jgi:hypothetical protein
MLQLVNDTPFAASRAILLDGRGSQLWVVVIKATFRFDAAGRVELAAEQEPVTGAPVYAGAPSRSTLLRDTEIVAAHPGTDVTVNGSAHAPDGREVAELDVGFAVDDMRRTLRVFGDRRWDAGAFGLSRTRPAPFRSMPITWERAFGGADEGGEHPRNPIGRGFASSADRLLGAPLPNIEDPADPIVDARSRPAPAGLSAVPAQWSPRRELAGTYDDAWAKTRAPLWPADMDPRFFRSAPAGLTSERHLVGGEKVTLLNLSPAPVVSFRLPRVALVIHTHFARSSVRQRVRLDRVIVEPDATKCVLVWRSALDCGRAARDVRESVISTKEVISW